MLHFVIPLLMLTSGVRCGSYHSLKHSAASPAQIRFAQENNFDGTGPGAKGPESAYSTYNNLDDALISFLNDPDTKLPRHEQARAIASLYKHNHYHPTDNSIVIRTDTFTGNRQKAIPILLSRYNKYDVEPKQFTLKGVHVSAELRAKEPFKWQKEHAVKPSHLNIARYNKEVDFKIFHKPESFYDNGKSQEDVNSGSEIRYGTGAVQGYYTEVQPDGKRRVVHYQSDPIRGFKSSDRRVYRP